MARWLIEVQEVFTLTGALGDVERLEPRARFVTVGVDANPQRATRFGVRDTPALFAFDGGGEIATRHIGVTGLAPCAAE